jgi:hypothetical protein
MVLAEVEDRALHNLLEMYGAAIAELRRLGDPEVDGLIARLQVHERHVMQVLERSQPLAEAQ